ncbi:MAG: RNA-binding cell elongation regulator Jag/EloR [Thermoanaerobacteraceae bacterium]
MKELIRTGKTVDDAVELALREFGVDRSMVDIQILDEGSKGFLGILGKQAVVKVILKDMVKEKAREFLQSVIKAMDVDVDFDIIEESDYLKINLYGKNVGLLIGYRGDTLDSLQYLTNLVANKAKPIDKYKKIVLDAENYREKREKTLINLAKRLAREVVEKKKSIELEPMNANERRIIHMALQDDPLVETYSEGTEPNRYVVISLR